MTNLEHIIENTLVDFEKGYDADDIRTGICKDPNLKGIKISTDQIYEICQYVYCTYLDNGHRLVDGKTMTNAEKLAKNTDLMKEMIVLYCRAQPDCKKCMLAKNQSCAMYEHTGIDDFLESEATDEH